jgi:hypothetical protein
MIDGVAYLHVEVRDLLCRFDVAPEEDDAARLDFAQKLAKSSIQTCAGKADKQEASGLALD